MRNYNACGGGHVSAFFPETAGFVPA